MAESLTVRQAESVRLMIDSSKVVNRLQKHLDGDVDLSATQVQSAKILLDKSLPSLQSADITAHSSPQIESKESILSQFQSLMAKYPNEFKALMAQAQGMALLPGGTQVGDEAVSAPQQQGVDAGSAEHNVLAALSPDT